MNRVLCDLAGVLLLARFGHFSSFAFIQWYMTFHHIYIHLKTFTNADLFIYDVCSLWNTNKYLALESTAGTNHARLRGPHGGERACKCLKSNS